MKNLLSVVVPLFFFGCKTTSLAVKPPAGPAPQVSASAAVVDSLMAHSFQYQWFSGKAKVTVTRDSNTVDFTANFRIKKDSAVWISISPALGVEVARLLMTKDSIRVIDRLDKKRYTRGYDFFRAFTSLPIDFNTVQNVVTGQLFYTSPAYEVRAHETETVMVGRQDGVEDSVVIGKSFSIMSQYVRDSNAGDILSENGQYDVQYNPPFSLWRKIIIHHPGELVVELTFNKIKINEPLKFPFKGGD